MRSFKNKINFTSHSELVSESNIKNITNIQILKHTKSKKYYD